MISVPYLLLALVVVVWTMNGAWKAAAQNLLGVSLILLPRRWLVGSKPPKLNAPLPSSNTESFNHLAKRKRYCGTHESVEQQETVTGTTHKLTDLWKIPLLSISQTSYPTKDLNRFPS